ncbi:MAG: prolipoprotein diacylglyceryl transferase [Bdellovibrionales bacterium]|nr:prolipoprotein diacylglyceryl transferase [Bdellovibrionales bacterium]
MRCLLTVLLLTACAHAPPPDPGRYLQLVVVSTNDVHGFVRTSEFSWNGQTILSGGAEWFAGYVRNLERKHGPRLIEIAPVAPLCITIAHAFGRLGCFFAGCCYGKPTDSFFGVRFPNMLHRVYPTQLFESLFLFLLFGVLYYLVFERRSYQAFAIYLFSYGVFRFGIEFIRGDHRGVFVGSLSPSQTLSLVMVASSVGVWFLAEHLARAYRGNAALKDKLEI